MSTRRSTRSQSQRQSLSNGVAASSTSFAPAARGSPSAGPVRAPPQFIQYALNDPPTISIVAMVENPPIRPGKPQLLLPFEAVWEVLWGSGIPSDLIIYDPLVMEAPKFTSFKTLRDHQLQDMVRFARKIESANASTVASSVPIFSPPKSARCCGVLALPDLARILPKHIAHVSRPTSPVSGAVNGAVRHKALKPTQVPLPLRAFNPAYILDEAGQKWAATLPRPTRPPSPAHAAKQATLSPPRSPPFIAASHRSAPPKLAVETIDVSDSSNDADNEDDSDVEFVGFKSRRPMSVEWVTSPPPKKLSRSTSLGLTSSSQSSQRTSLLPQDEWRPMSSSGSGKSSEQGHHHNGNQTSDSQLVFAAPGSTALTFPDLSIQAGPPSTPAYGATERTRTPSSAVSRATTTPRVPSSPIMSFSPPASLFGSASASAPSGQSGLETDDTDTLRERSYVRLTASLGSMNGTGQIEEEEQDELEPTPSPQMLSIPLGQQQLTGHPWEESSAPSSRSEAEEPVDADMETVASGVFTQVRGRAKQSKLKSSLSMDGDQYRWAENGWSEALDLPEVESPTILSQQPAAALAAAMPTLHLDAIGRLGPRFGICFGEDESQSVLSQQQPRRELARALTRRPPTTASLVQTTTMALHSSPSPPRPRARPSPSAGEMPTTRTGQHAASRSASSFDRQAQTQSASPPNSPVNQTPVFRAKRSRQSGDRTPDFLTPTAYRLTSSQRLAKKRMFEALVSSSMTESETRTETETDEKQEVEPPLKRPRLGHEEPLRVEKEQGAAQTNLACASLSSSGSDDSSSSSSNQFGDASGSSSDESIDEEDEAGGMLTRIAYGRSGRQVPLDVLRKLMPLSFAMAAARHDGTGDETCADQSRQNLSSESGSDSDSSECEDARELSSGSSDSTDGESMSESSDGQVGACGGDSESEGETDMESPQKPLASVGRDHLLRMLFPLSYRPPIPYSVSESCTDDVGDDVESASDDAEV